MLSSDFNFVNDVAVEMFGRLDPLDRQHMLIAGGAPRDLIMGKTVKDVDFIIDYNALKGKYGIGNANTKFFHLLGAFGGLNKLKDGPTGPYHPTSSVDFSVFSSNDNLVQVIQTRLDPDEFVDKTFDFGLCCAVVDDCGNFFVNDWFIEDAREEKLTLYVRKTLSSYQLDRAVREHYPRLIKKYPNFPLNVKYIDEGADRPTWHPYRGL